MSFFCFCFGNIGFVFVYILTYFSLSINFLNHALGCRISHLNSSVSIAESNEPLREVMMDVDSEKVSTQGGTIDKKLADSVQVEANTVANPEDLDSSLDASMDEIKESGTQSSHENVKSQMVNEIHFLIIISEYTILLFGPIYKFLTRSS